MQSDILPAFSPLDLIGRLGRAEPAPVLSTGSAPNSWRKFLAFNPSDTLSCDSADIDSLHQFVDKHRGHFIFGYLSYELGYELQQITDPYCDLRQMPLFHFSAYPNYMEFLEDKTILYHIDPDYPHMVAEIMNRQETIEVEKPILELSAPIPYRRYSLDILRILAYIRAGDIYQANYTHRLSGVTNLSGRILFRQLLNHNRVTHAAYLETTEYSISSLSPEGFVRISGKDIVTTPIKGTRPRGIHPELDEKMLSELLNSRKEQAELYMIIDLLRNDLGKVCTAGSVVVEQQKAVQKLKNVFHTYGRIRGELRETVTGLDALLSMFPGGSITGCPKRRAMEIIGELEDYPREVYTGAIGYILPGGDMEFNIAIRTLIQRGFDLELGMGGGITIHSNAEDEFAETLSKADSFRL